MNYKEKIDLNIKKIALQHFLIILVGVAIFYIDEIEFLDNFFPKLFLLVVAFGKSVYFIFHSFKMIEEASVNNHTYNKFLIVILTNIFLIVLSFMVDYLCLYNFDSNSFKGLVFTNSQINSIFDFSYFSVLTFTTTGFGDIYPITRAAKMLVTMEVVVAFITTIIVISNFIHIKESIHDFSFLKIKKRNLSQNPIEEKTPEKELIGEE